MYVGLTEQTWKPHTSVKVRFALAQGFFVAMIICLLAGTLYFPVRNRLVSITDSSYKILVNTLAASIYPSFQNGDRTEVVKALQRVEGQEGVKYVLLVEKDNTVYYDSIAGNDTLKGKQLVDQTTSEIEARRDTVVEKTSRTIDGKSTTYYNYSYPFTANNEVVYTIRLGIDEQVIEGEFNRLSRLFIYLGSFGILLGVVAAYFLTARMTRPIIALTESALAIRAGNLNAYPTIATNDELEQLSREFQGMVEKLKQFYFQEYAQKKQALTAKKRVEEINTRLQELDRQKTDFLNTASHQLRTPLSVIHWSLSIIVEEAEHLGIPSDRQELLKESLASTKRMVDMVNGLLDISRIEQGRRELNWEKGNVGTVVSSLVKALQPLALNKGLELTFEEKTPISDSYLDPKSFYEVVNNFVDNAIKYTAQGYVHVAVAEADGRALITISDSGIGMDDDERERLFTRFARGKEASKMFANGSGLGMYVAQSILKQHGGSIDVESEKNKGTTFTLGIPLYQEVPRALAAGDDTKDDDKYKQVGATTTAHAA